MVEQVIQPDAPPVSPEPEPVATPPPMRSNVVLVWTDDLWRGQGNPHGMRSGTLLRGYRLLEALGALQWQEVQVVEPDPALGSRAALTRFHDEAYLQTVAALNDGNTSLLSAQAFGFDEAENAPFPDMAPAAARYVAAARTAVQQVLSGAVTAAISLAGRQQHARHARAQADHIFNDVWLALQDARDAGQRVAFISLEAERPAVIEEATADSDSLLFVSLHEDPFFVYPGPDASKGAPSRFSVNVPMVPGAGDEAFVAAFEQVVVPLLGRFAPDVTVLLAGSTAHRTEPLNHLRLTTNGYARLFERINALSPRLVLLGGEGSDMDATARVWAIALATLVGRGDTLPPTLPVSYARSWGEGTLHDAPLRRLSRQMEEYVATSTRQAIVQAQRALFPQWGLELPAEARGGAFDDGLTEPGPRSSERFSARPREVKLQRRSPDEVRAALRDEAAQAPSLEEPGDAASPQQEERRTPSRDSRHRSRRRAAANEARAADNQPPPPARRDRPQSQPGNRPQSNSLPPANEGEANPPSKDGKGRRRRNWRRGGGGKQE